MALTKRQTAAIAVARKQLGLSDSEYRAALFDVAGASSAKQLDGTGFELLVDHFKRLGWQPRFRRDFYGFRPGMATPAAISLIRALWDEYTGEAGSDLTLGKWLHRTFGVSHPRFVTAEQAQKAIGALRGMVKRRAGAKSAPPEGSEQRLYPPPARG